MLLVNEREFGVIMGDMDSVSHALVGLTLSRLDIAREFGAVAAVTLTAASLLPDADVATRALGRMAYLKHHRGITHGFVVLPLEAALFSGVLWALWPAARDAGFAALFLMSLAALLVHVLFDALTPYGTRLLLPFRADAVTTNSMPIFDPFLLLITGTGLVLSYTREAWANRLALGILAAWVLFFALYAFAKSRARSLLRRHNGTVGPADTFPVPGKPLTWLCVVRGKRFDETFTVNVLTGRQKHLRRYRVHAFPRELRCLRMARVFLDFARHPLVEVSRSGRGKRYVLRDLRFDFPYKRQFFRWEVLTDARGKVVHDRFRF